MLKHALLAGVALVAFGSAAQADLSISSKPTKNMNCSGGVCTATAKGANLSTADLTAMLASGDVTVKTGGGALTIQVLNAFAWTSTSRLTLDAAVTVGIRDTVAVQGTGAVTIKTNDGGSGGDLNFFDTGKLDFWDTSSNLTINGDSYMLLPDLPTFLAYVNENPSGLFAFAKDDAEGAKLRGAAVPYFHGVFEGLGHTISSVTLTPTKKSRPLGLFGTSDGTIRDLRLTQISATGAPLSGGLVGTNAGILIGDSVSGTVEGTQAGGLAGSTTGVIARCSSTGKVSGYYAGGIAGEAAGTIDGSYSSMQVGGTGSGPAYEGGLVGRMTSGVLSNSHASGGVGDGVIFSVAGGLVGAIWSATVENSYATGDATSVDGPAGGLAGDNEGVVRQSFALGNAYARTDAQGAPGAAGGLVGGNSGTIENTYARGNAKTDGGQSGGFLGTNNGNGTATAVYSTGTPVSTLNGQGQVGGFIGADLATLNLTYWNMDSSGIDKRNQGAGNRKHDPGIKGLSDLALKSTLPKGFDPQIWGQNAATNDGYPYLLGNPPQ